MWQTQLRAVGTLGIDTLDVRGSGELDFHQLSVRDLKYILEFAYRAGYTAGATDARENNDH